MTNQRWFKINGHTIYVPPDMKAFDDEKGYPGAYDYILYKGIEICTFDMYYDVEQYIGPFVFYHDEAMFNVANLDEARKVIDKFREPCLLEH